MIGISESARDHPLNIVSLEADSSQAARKWDINCGYSVLEIPIRMTLTFFPEGIKRLQYPTVGYLISIP